MLVLLHQSISQSKHISQNAYTTLNIRGIGAHYLPNVKDVAAAAPLPKFILAGFRLCHAPGEACSFIELLLYGRGLTALVDYSWRHADVRLGRRRSDELYATFSAFLQDDVNKGLYANDTGPRMSMEEHIAKFCKVIYLYLSPEHDKQGAGASTPGPNTAEQYSSLWRQRRSLHSTAARWSYSQTPTAQLKSLL
eukprot:jgi/Astpho2/1279/Aster-07123